MYNYYFDRPDLREPEPVSGQTGPEGWRFQPPAEPETPPRRPPISPRRVCRVRRARRNRRAAAVLCLFLTLILGGSGILLVLGMNGLLPGVASFPAEVEDWAPPVESSLPATTVARAPLGDAELIIRPQSEGPFLSSREIYVRNLPSIVSIRSTVGEGFSLGTGIVFTADGYIVTNHHVIEGASAVTVSRLDDPAESYNALLVGSDARTDLAVLKVEAGDLIPAEFGDSAALQVGDPAYAIGNPLGATLPGTMTEGIISYLDRSIQVDGYERKLIQTSAALNSGNSGGALVNGYGQVVGVTTLKMMSDFDTIEGLGFAIPSATVKEIADELIARGYVTGRPVLGITAGPSRYYLEEGADRPDGLYVVSVEPRSDAWAQGVRAGDLILRANGRPTPDIAALNAEKEGLAVGESLELELYRDGEYRTIRVALVEEYTLEQ